MSRKTLLGLVVVLAALAAATWMSRRGADSASVPGAAGAGRLLPGVDLGTLSAIAIEDATATTHLARVDGLWTVAEQDHYAADFNRLRALVAALDETAGAQVAEEGAEHLADFGLAAGGDPAPVRVTLEHGAGTTVLNLGKTREPRRSEEVWMPPAGRYVRVDAGPVLLLKDDIPGVVADSAQWWDRNLLAVEPEAIRKIETTSASGTYAVERGTNGTFALAGAAEGETVDVAAANRLFGALRNLRAERILQPEDVETAFSNVVTCTAETEGATYRIQLGAAPADQGGGRPLQIEVSGDAGLAARKLAGRAFWVPAYLADPLALEKNALVRKAEPPPAEPAPESGDPPAADQAPAAPEMAPDEALATEQAGDAPESAATEPPPVPGDAPDPESAPSHSEP